MLVVTVAAGVLIWLNVGRAAYYLYGWPVSMYSYDFTYFDGVTGGYHRTPTSYDGLRFTFNIVFNLFVLYCVAATCEKRIAGKRKCKVRTYLLMILVGGLGILWNLDSPVYHYYGGENSVAPVTMRVLSIVVALFLTRFVSEVDY